MFAPRYSAKQLAALCHRLAIELSAGIDIRRSWQREAQNAPSNLQPVCAQIRDAVAEGETLTAAVSATENAFPILFREMVQVGEQTGMLAEVFRRLDDHYHRQVKMRKNFLGLIAWPMIQLVIAIVVIGLMILIMGMIGGRSGGEPIDILGFGLVGTRGLIAYVNFIIACGLCVAGIIYAFQRGMLWTRSLQKLLVKLPAIGPAIEKICLARMTWAMHLTLNVEMDLRKLVPLVLRATGNQYYIDQSPLIVEAIVGGMPMHEAFRVTGVFPEHFLDALEVGEESGQIVESMGRLSEHYQEEAESATKVLSTIAGMGIWLLIAMLIIAMIFRIFGFYLNALSGAM